jgi:dihydrofolate reductase
MDKVISLIAALGKNRVIGNENKLIWSIPDDMKHFRQLTSGKSIIMGRKTYESIGKPLPNRKNIIITRDKNYKAEGCIVVHSAEESLNAAGDGEVMVIGGAQIYSEFLPRANRMYLTLIEKNFEGDAYFPRYDDKEWKITEKEDHEHDDFKYSFLTLEKK